MIGQQNKRNLKKFLRCSGNFLTQVIKETWMARPDYKQKKWDVKVRGSYGCSNDERMN